MRRLLLALAFFTLATPAFATHYEPAIGVTFPDEVAGLPFVGKKEFPQKELGTNYGYARPGPVRGSVYVYTGGAKAIPTGTDAPVVRKHFAQVIAEVQQLQTQGQARAITLHAGTEQTTSYPGCGPQFVWRSYDMVLDEANTLTSFTYLTGMKDNFVKLRVSYRKGDAQGARDAERFVLEIRKVLGGCR